MGQTTPLSGTVMHAFAKTNETAAPTVQSAAPTIQAPAHPLSQDDLVVLDEMMQALQDPVDEARVHELSAQMSPAAKELVAQDAEMGPKLAAIDGPEVQSSGVVDRFIDGAKEIGEGVIDGAKEIGEGVIEAGKDIIEPVLDNIQEHIADPILETIGLDGPGLRDALQNWWEEEDSSSPGEGTASPTLDLEDDETKKRDKVLDAAETIAKNEKGKHKEDSKSKDDINCSLFVKKVLLENSETSEKMDDTFTLNNIPLAYYEGTTSKEPGEDGKEVVTYKSTKLRLVENHMVVNHQPEATAALLQAQGDSPNLVKPGDATHTALIEDGMKDVPSTEFYFYDKAFGSNQTFIGMAADENAEFGCAAAAVSMGGKPVNEADRKPGDLQQAMKMDGNRKLTGKGHASIVWEVKGNGVCFWDPDNDTTALQPTGKKPDAGGWFEGEWVLSGETDPQRVSSFQTTIVKMIDANTKGSTVEGPGDRGDDATQVGDFDKNNNGSDTQITSNGRLPDSKWLNWSETPVKEVKPLS
jgi:hypothetical protein